MTPSSKPLYSHALPEIENWLTDQGCQRNREDISQWKVSRSDWSAELYLDVDSIVVDYASADGTEIQRSFRYSLSRSDLEEVIFAGP
ncbi:MAG: DUF3143 domain-containing protein [Leptolyngbya foveolarum]|uniref:DUF3143 domain-containing protein n=1 Tax=Leptolyngbya foveolarum TaxID=47253 RepID=A0A2W4UQH5_9CYAN|nr:MAG: DUF3143 domain-containing protein [Leptolyngbya foveolarum]